MGKRYKDFGGFDFFLAVICFRIKNCYGCRKIRNDKFHIDEYYISGLIIYRV